MNERFVQCAPHEGDLHLIFAEYGLKPFFAMDSIRKQYDGWRTAGKPTRSVEIGGTDYAVCYDYDTDNPLDPRDHKDYQLETVPQFRFYFVAKDELYDDERADRSARVRGGTMTVRPRWDGLTRDGGIPVKGIPKLGSPYIDVQIQASNIVHSQYHELVKSVIGAFDVNDKYLRNPHEISNWSDAAVYVRLKREDSGPIYAADGPIARTHQLLEGDRSGYRKHVEDHRKLPGYYVTTSISDQRAHDLIKGHTLGKEIKHYYPIYPENREPSDPLYHPKVEASYQTSITDKTVYWSDTDDMIRELEETILNTLDWAGMPLEDDGEGPFRKDVYFKPSRGKRRSRKLVDCPLPKIEDAQGQAVMSLWGDTLQSDKDVLELLVADGGTISPQKASDETGHSYRTIRNVVSRCEAVIEHSYGKLEIASKYQRDLILDRIRAKEQQLKNSLEDAVLTAADAINGRDRSRWTKAKRKYNISVDTTDDRSRKLIEPSYRAADRDEAETIRQEIRNAYVASHNERAGTSGVHLIIQLEDGKTQTYKNLKPSGNTSITPKRGSRTARKFREKIEQVSEQEWAEYFGSTT